MFFTDLKSLIAKNKKAIFTKTKMKKADRIK